MNKILITGANSFVGKNFIKKSTHRNIEEICLLKNKVEEINFRQYNTILHLAAIVHQTSKIPESKYFEVNTELCRRVALKAKSQGVKQFILLSTVKVYGNKQPQNTIWDEFSKCLPDDAYGKSKYMAEQELQKLNSNDFCVSIIRSPLIYGKGVKANMLNIIKLVNRFPILPLGNIKNKRSLVSIDNLIHLIDLIISKKTPGIFIALDNQAISTTSLVRIIASHLNKKIILITLPKTLVWIGKKLLPGIFDKLFNSYEFSNTNTCKTLNFKPVVSLNDGIKSLVEELFNNNKN